jgi:hypothetical protein
MVLGFPAILLLASDHKDLLAGAKLGGPSREAEIGRGAAWFFVPDWSCELRYRLLPSDKTATA